MNSPLKFSVITVCLNAAPHIEAAIKSVLSQSYPNIEFVVIDGGSTDGTVEIINRYKDRLGYFVSEPDKGLYNAMNKGIKAATGDVLFFLNSDDYFVDDSVLDDVARAFVRNAEAEIIFGNLIFTDGAKRWVKKQKFDGIRERLARNHVQHQTLFARKEVFELAGGFYEEYKIVSDYEWEIRAFLVHGCRYAYMDRDISVMSTQGVSSTTDFEPERRKVMKKYFSALEILRYRRVPLKLARLRRLFGR